MRWRTYSIDEAKITDEGTNLTIQLKTQAKEPIVFTICTDEAIFSGILPKDVTKNPHLYVFDEELQFPPIVLNEEAQREPIRRIRKKAV